MKIVSAAEMREIDRATSERFGISSQTLMENAGAAVARIILSDYPRAQRISVICGKGNNGGDGFVAARHLAESGRVVRVVLLGAPEEVRGSAAVMLQKLQILPLVLRDPSALDSADAANAFAADLIVDAILGTGFRPPVQALYAAAISRMNRARSTVIAVDVPSGSDADSMEHQNGIVARADAVVTFTALRPAHIFGQLTNGPTVIAPIGSPPESIVSKLQLHLSTAADFASLLAPRQRDANKGNYGHVLVLGGSLGKAGAAAMAGFAALRAGAGLSTVATARSAVASVAGFYPELMTEPLPETDAGTIARQALKTVSELLNRIDVLAIGPGISRHSETSEAVRVLVQEREIPMVLDADALNAFEGSAELLTGRGRSIVITPHPGEMSRLTGMTIAEVQANRVDVARRFAREHQLIVVLKGHRTLVASPEGDVWANPTGNPGMATGGTGDVLTGMVAGLIAQHPQQVFEATVLAVYLHGLAGDMAVRDLGEHSLVATDLLRYLPKAFIDAAQVGSEDVRLQA